MYTFVTISLVLATASAHTVYQNMIPNGHSVPDPCGSGVWLAVGHYNALHHTHDKNKFGLDFAAAGHKWTVTLCQMDSDNDGKSNGEELGDPGCTWTQGTTPSQAASSHPGTFSKYVPLVRSCCICTGRGCICIHYYVKRL